MKTHNLAASLLFCLFNTAHTLEEPDFTDGSGMGGTGHQIEQDIPELPPIIDSMNSIGEAGGTIDIIENPIPDIESSDPILFESEVDGAETPSE